MAGWIKRDEFSNNRLVKRITMPGGGEHDIVTDYGTVNKLIARAWTASRKLGGEGVQFPINEKSKYWSNETDSGQTLNEVQQKLVFLSRHWGLNEEHYKEFQLYCQKVQSFLLRCQGVEEVLEALLTANRPFEESDLDALLPNKGKPDVAEHDRPSGA